MLKGRGIKWSPVENTKRNVIRFCFIVFCFYVLSSTQVVFAATKDTAVSKDTITVNVSTVEQSNWYDDRNLNGKDDDKDGKIDAADPDWDGGNAGLKVNLICDKDENKSSGYRTPLPTDTTYTPCDKDGAHDDYYSTSTSNESYVQPTDKNFTIKVSASDPSGIDSIKIEWISGASVKREGGSYWDPIKLEEYRKIDKDLKPHKSSFTCSNAQSCEICVVGGACAHPVIPTGDLGNPGKQQIMFFRLTVTDGAMNSVTTGFDETNVKPILDKFYRFVICSTSCNTDPDKCTNNNPVVVLAGYEENVSCFESIPLYTLKWKFRDNDKKDRPSSYVLEARERSNPSVVYVAARTAPDNPVCRNNSSGYKVECDMSATLFQGFLQKSDGSPANIEWGNKAYEWRVKVYDDSKESHCLGVSEWSPWSSGESFVTPYAPPIPSFTAINSANPPLDCLSGECNSLEDINFTSTSQIDLNSGVPAYKWYIDGPILYSTQDSMTKVFSAEVKNHSVELVVTDGMGRTCKLRKNFFLGDANIPIAPQNPSWDEIAPG